MDTYQQLINDNILLQKLSIALYLLIYSLVSGCGGSSSTTASNPNMISPTSPPQTISDTSNNLSPINETNSSGELKDPILTNPHHSETTDPKPIKPFIIPFDSKDNGIVFRASLKSSASILLAGGIEESTSTNTFDDTLGMKPGAINGGVPGARFSLDTIPGLANLESGQLSIEVEREWLSITNPEVRSNGYTHTGDEYLLSHGEGISNLIGKFYLQSDQKVSWFFNTNEGSTSSHFINSVKSKRFAKITISWTRTKADLYVDGLKFGTLPRTDQSTSHFATIYIGNLMGTNVSPFKGSYFIRNLIVASKPVIINDQAHLKHIVQIGDSFAAGQPFFNIPPIYDGTIANTIIKELINHGLGFGKYSVYSNGGGQIQDNGHDPLELDAGQLLNRAEVLALNPTFIIFITGGNDTSIFNSFQFTDDLHDHIEAYLGENGHPLTTTKQVVVTTTTSNLNANHPATLQMRQIILDLPKWWDSKYPSRVGAVSVIDTWTIFGGAQVDKTLFGLADPVHPAASGNIVYGVAIADEIKRLTYRQLPDLYQ